MRDQTPSAQADARGKKPSPVAKVLGQVAATLRADRDMLEVLRTFSGLNPSAIEKCTPEEARRQPTPADAVKKLLESRGQSSDPEDLVPGVTTEDRLIPGPGGEMRTRIYTPPGEGPFGVILYFHGGGWVLADLQAYDGSARGLAQAAHAIVVSVDYRQAPEARFPAAWDDALAAYRWVAENASEIGGDGRRLALAGESAGGCLAISTAISVRSLGFAHPRHLLAIYPVAQTGNLGTPSYIENAIAQPLNREMMAWFFGHVLGSAADKDNPRIDLINADLAGLPPVTIINAMIDPLRSDGALLEDALREAGVEVTRKDYRGVTHEFFGMAAVVKKAREAQKFAGEQIQKAFAAVT